MFSFLPKPLIGVLNILFHAINLLFCSILVYIFALFKLLFWGKRSFKIFDTLGTWVARLLTFNNKWFMRLTTKTHYEVSGAVHLSRREWYLLISNHQSWADILVLEHVFAPRIPMLKFFLKKELFWVPLVGSCCWALNFPFMKRYSQEFIKKNPHLKGKDLETTKNACERFKHIPSTMINFIEGTRFTPEKHKKQQSPYPHLLKPKAGGAAFIIDAMGEVLHMVLDVTIVYPDSKHIAWDYFCGKFDKIIVDINTIEIDDNLRGDYTNDENFKAFFQTWLNQRWQEKEQNFVNLKAKFNDKNP